MIPTLSPERWTSAQAEAVADVEDLPLLSLGAVDQTAVGEDAVDVEEQPVESLGAFSEGFVRERRHLRTAPAPRGRAGGPPLRARPSASQTKSEVMRWSSMVLSAAAASSSGGIVRGTLRHALPGRAPEQGLVRLQQAPEVAVRDAAGQAALVVGHRGDAEALLRHLVDRLAHRRAGGDTAGRASPGMHELVDLEQPLAELAGGVEEREVFPGEAARLQQRHGEGVAHRQCRGRRGGRRQVQRTGLAVDRYRQVEVRVPGERRGRRLAVITTSGTPSRFRVSISRSSSSVVPE